MAFHDPLRKFETIDSSNFLKPRLQDFLNLEGKPEPFYEAIRVLERMKKVFLVAQTINRLNEISYLDHYVNAIQWLNFQLGLGNWVAVSQIQNYDQIDESTANNFNGYVANLSSNIVNQNLFQQIEMMSGVIQTKIVNDIAEKVEVPFEEKMSQYLYDGRSELVASLDKTKQDNEASINDLYNRQLEDIRNAGANAIAEFTQARSLANWSDFYARRVNEYEHSLFGKKWPTNAALNKWLSFHAYRNTLSVKTRAKSFFQFIPGLWRCVRKALSIIYSKLMSYSGKRAAWFLLLTLGVLALILINGATILGINSVFGVDLSQLKPQHNDTQIFAKVTLYLALFLVPTIGYSFANKNFRIYSNLLEQYRHREVVAQTIQGILAAPRGDENDDAVRKELANVASVALFEQKTVGHLSKNEANSTSIIDIVKALRP